MSLPWPSPFTAVWLNDPTESGRLRAAPAERFASQILRRQYHYMDNSSGVGVIDKAAQVLDALEAGPTTLAQLVAATGSPWHSSTTVWSAATSRAGSSLAAGSWNSPRPRARTA